MQQENKLVIEGTQAKIEEPKKLKMSYFSDQYQQAFQAVQDIIDQNLPDKTGKVCAKKQNIIPFIGKRGSGKTSAMMSFSAYLKKYHDLSEKPYVFKKGKDNIDVKFLCFESIDGSLLEKGEDIFKLILAQMYGEFFQKDKMKRGYSWEKGYDYEKRELQQLFDKVYRSACELEKNSSELEHFGESSILTLKNLSSSLQLTRDFEDLVRRYLAFLDYAESGSELAEKSRELEKSFLVITVDDLDLNLHQGYEMLEKLHRYTMVGNVIIMMSVDYNQLEVLCEKQFYSMIPKFDSELQKRSEYVKQLSRDFLNKVFPGNFRIYMPTFNNTDALEVTDNKNQAQNPKELLFKMLYQKLGLRLDTEGTKRHFYEQESLRTFVSFYLMLNSMENITGKKSDATFYHNYKMLMADTLNRMVDEKLDSDYMELFRKFTENDALHAARNLYTEVVRFARSENYSVELSRNESNMLASLGRRIAASGYSYGEILRIIYCWGRINNEGKAFVRCFLAYSTLELSKDVFQFNRSELKNKRYIADVMNGAVVGSWANQIMPKTFIALKTRSIGMVQNVDMEQVFQIEFNGKNEMKPDSEKGYMVVKTKTSDIYKAVKRYVKSIVVFAMFFDQPIYKMEDSQRWHLAMMNETQNEKKLRQVGENSERKLMVQGTGYATFNVFSFISNAFLYEENVKPIIDEACNIILGTDETNRTIRNALINEINKEFTDWLEESKGFAVPIYSVDVTYNMIKRLRQRERARQAVNINQLWSEIIDIYQAMEEKLAKNDEKYEKYTSKSDRVEYAKLFRQCPYVKWIMNDSKKPSTELMDGFEEEFKKLISYLLRILKEKDEQKKEELNTDIEENWGYDD